MSLSKAISIIVPTLNEAGNIQPLLERINKAFDDSDITYEVVFIDDHSSDHTKQNILNLALKHPVRLFDKNGERGKAYSLLQGFQLARYDVLCMIDADLQYPPEAIVPMFRMLQTENADLVISEREDHATSRLRQLSSKMFHFVFTRLLFGFDYDSQSGLKLFKKSVVDGMHLNPTPWSFDLEFIVRALEKDCRILRYPIPFSERHSGAAKIKLAAVTYELAKAAVMLRLNSSTDKVRQAYRRNQRFTTQPAVRAVGSTRLSGLIWAALVLAGLMLAIGSAAHAQVPRYDTVSTVIETTQVSSETVQASLLVTFSQKEAFAQELEVVRKEPAASPSENINSGVAAQPTSNDVTLVSVAAEPQLGLTQSKPLIARGLFTANGSLNVRSLHGATYPQYDGFSDDTYRMADSFNLVRTVGLGVVAILVLAAFAVALLSPNPALQTKPEAALRKSRAHLRTLIRYRHV